MVEMTIDSIRVSMVNYQRVVILKEKGSERYLPIWIGPFEANAIAMKLKKIGSHRPMTHDLIKNIVIQFEAQVEKIVVTELRDNTFYALIHLRFREELLTIDSRPSDAIALALRTDSPIFVTEEVINNSRSITLDKENLDPEDVKKWLENLNPEDLGKYKM